MIKIQLNGKEPIDVPQSWNEMTLEQIYLCHHILFRQGFEILIQEEVMPFIRIELMKAITGIDDEYMDLWRADCLRVDPVEGELTFAEEVHELCKITDFFYEEVEPNVYHAKPGLTKNPFPSIGSRSKILNIRGKAKRIELVGPADGLKNITFYEMAYLFTRHNEYLKSKSEKVLNEIIATLYRRPKKDNKKNRSSAYNGDRRLPFRDHEATIPGRASTIAHLPKEAKMLILFWFASCRQDIIETFPYIFKKGSSGDSKYGWAAVIWQLSDGILNTEKVQDKNYEDALAYLNFKIEQDRMKTSRNL